MSKKIIILFLIFLIGVFGCKKQTTEPETALTITNLPGKITTDVPDSLKTNITRSGGQSSGYTLTKSFVQAVLQTMKFAAVVTVVADQTITGISYSSQERTKTLTLTQPLINLINSILPEGETINYPAGTPFSLRYIYNTVSSSDSIGTGYDVVFKIIKNTNDPQDQNIALYWTTDKKKIKIVLFQASDTNFTKIDFSSEYNDMTKSVLCKTYKTDGTTISGKIGLREDTNNISKDGIYVSFYFNEDTVANVKGYADDDGGYISASVTNSSGTFYYKEGFNKIGQYRYVKYSTNNTTWYDGSAIGFQTLGQDPNTDPYVKSDIDTQISIFN